MHKQLVIAHLLHYTAWQSIITRHFGHILSKNVKGLVLVQNSTASRVVYMVYGYTSCTSYIRWWKNLKLLHYIHLPHRWDQEPKWVESNNVSHHICMHLEMLPCCDKKIDNSIFISIEETHGLWIFQPLPAASQLKLSFSVQTKFAHNALSSGLVMLETPMASIIHHVSMFGNEFTKEGVPIVQ